MNDLYSQFSSWQKIAYTLIKKKILKKNIEKKKFLKNLISEVLMVVKVIYITNFVNNDDFFKKKV